MHFFLLVVLEWLLLLFLCLLMGRLFPWYLAPCCLLSNVTKNDLDRRIQKKKKMFQCDKWGGERWGDEVGWGSQEKWEGEGTGLTKR